MVPVQQPRLLGDELHGHRDPGSTFTFPADLVPGTAYAVYAWWTTGANRYTAVPFEIRDGGTTLNTVIVNQFINGGQWNLLGIYMFNGAASVRVLAAPNSSFSVNADAVRFVPVVVDEPGDHRANHRQ